MKRPIEVSEIRKGDLIRWEFDGDKAHELRAVFERDRSYPTADRIYLLDRPEPAVELPTEPTLGWISQEILDYNPLGFWAMDDRHVRSHDDRMFLPEDVTAFTPATAVPTEALDKLRNYSLIGEYTLLESVQQFFAAVDKVNEAQR